MELEFDASVNSEHFVDIAGRFVGLKTLSIITITWFSIIASISVRRAIIHVRSFLVARSSPFHAIESNLSRDLRSLYAEIDFSIPLFLSYTQGEVIFAECTGERAIERNTGDDIIYVGAFYVCACRRVCAIACTTLHLGDNLKG